MFHLLYIMNICLGVGTRTLSLPRPFPFLYYTISIYRNEEHSFPHLPLSHTFLTLSTRSLYTLLLYTLYRYREYFSATFPALSHTFIILLLYIEEGTFSPPLFTPLIK